MKQFASTTTLAVIALAAGVATASAQDSIKVGVIQPLTGAFAASGNYVANGAKIAADEINAKGGVLGKKLELVIEDNKSNPTEAAAVAEKLIVRDKVPVMMGAWGSGFTLAIMPKLMEYKVPMLVETSSAGKITTSGNPYIFRISPPSAVEATAFAKIVDRLKIGKADFLVVNNDWGRGAAEDFGKMFKEHNIKVGLVETMDPPAQDMSAQLAKIKASDADTLIITTAVEQLTLIFKQAAALGLKKRIITTGGSQNPDQLIEQAGAAANDTTHITFFTPWNPNVSADPAMAKAFIDEWKKRGYPFAGLTESFRGYDGIRTIAAAITKAGKAEPEAIRAALWQIELPGMNGKIKFEKAGPAGQESGQSNPGIYLIKIENGKVVLPNALRRYEPPGSPRRLESARRKIAGAGCVQTREGHVDQFLQHLLNAVMLGGTYALLGIGLTLIFGIMRVVNFAHGELYAFGAYIVYLVAFALGLTFFLALVVAVIAGALLGALIEIVLLRPMRSADIDTVMLVMIGAWIVMQNTELLLWGGVAKAVVTPFPDAPLVIGPVSISWLRLFVLAAALLLIGASYVLIHRTKLGKAMRATFQDADTAALMGVNIKGIFTATFAIGSGLAAAAGALLGPVFLVTPTMGDLAALKAFAIVILGGLGNITGATIGGFILAFVEEIGAGYISSGYRDAMGFLIIIVVLLFKPTGLFARAERVG